MASHLTSFAQAVRVNSFPPLVYIDLPTAREAWEDLSQSGKARLAETKAKVEAARRRMKERAERQQTIGDGETTCACPSIGFASLDPLETITFEAPQDDIISQQPQVKEESDNATTPDAPDMNRDLKKVADIQLQQPAVHKEAEIPRIPDTPETSDVSSLHVHANQTWKDEKEEEVNDIPLRTLNKQSPQVDLNDGSANKLFLADPASAQSSSWGESAVMMEPLFCFLLGAVVAHWFFSRPNNSKYNSNVIAIHKTLGDPHSDGTASTSALERVNEKMARFEERLALLEANQNIAQLQEQLRASNLQHKQQDTPASEKMRPHRIQWDVMNVESPTSTTASEARASHDEEQQQLTPAAALPEKMRPDQIQWDTNAESPTSTMGSYAAEEARASLVPQQKLKSTPTAALPKKISPHGIQWDRNMESPSSTMASAEEEALLNSMMLASNANQGTLDEEALLNDMNQGTTLDEEALLNDMMLATDPSQRTDDSSVTSDTSEGNKSDVDVLLQSFQTELQTIQENLRTGNFQ